MKRVETKTVKVIVVYQSLLLAGLMLAGLILASPGAQAAPLPVITVSGVIADSSAFIPEAVPLAYDLTSWYGKPYTLVMTLDAEGVAGTQLSDPQLPGALFNEWVLNGVDFSLTINGAVVSSGSYIPPQTGAIETINNVILPVGLTGLPPGIQTGPTYDVYGAFAGDGTLLGCQGGPCSADAVHEYVGVGFQYFWDVANGDAITNNAQPNLLSGAPYFTGGLGDLFLEFNQLSTAGGFKEAGLLLSSATSVSVTQTPLPAAAWLLGSGLLGLIGVSRRRNT